MVSSPSIVAVSTTPPPISLYFPLCPFSSVHSRDNKKRHVSITYRYSVNCEKILSRSLKLVTSDAPELERSITPATTKVNHICIYFQQFQHSNIPYFFCTATKNLNNCTICYIIQLSSLSRGKKNLVFVSRSEKGKWVCFRFFFLPSLWKMGF